MPSDAFDAQITALGPGGAALFDRTGSESIALIWVTGPVGRELTKKKAEASNVAVDVYVFDSLAAV